MTESNPRTFGPKRIQRAAEYLLLAGFFIFFLLSFRGYYQLWVAIGLGLTTLCMNAQLTQIRERRRTADPGDRRRVIADTFETILFLVFIVVLSIGGWIRDWLALDDREHLSYVAAILTGLFLGGLAGEIFWQHRNLPKLDDRQRANYMTNLKRSIVFPYQFSRRVKG